MRLRPIYSLLHFNISSSYRKTIKRTWCNPGSGDELPSVGVGYSFAQAPVEVVDVLLWQGVSPTTADSRPGAVQIASFANDHFTAAMTLNILQARVAAQQSCKLTRHS